MILLDTDVTCQHCQLCAKVYAYIVVEKLRINLTMMCKTIVKGMRIQRKRKDSEM